MSSVHQQLFISGKKVAIEKSTLSVSLDDLIRFRPRIRGPNPRYTQADY